MRIRAIAAILLAGAGLAAGCGGGGGGGGASKPSEAQSAATGDIPDNQVFLVFRNSGAGYSVKYPEGWTRRGGGRDVAFQDKGNFVHIVVGTGRAATTHRTYTTTSAPDPVTGKRLTVMVDRYVFARGGRKATVDLGTPRGVDNVDAYRLIAHSFRWR